MKIHISKNGQNIGQFLLVEVNRMLQSGQISADDLGCRNAKTKKPILIEDLMSDYDIDLSPDALGIYIPADELLKRTAYQWFAELCPRKVLEANTMISKYLLVSQTVGGQSPP
jgi:hypothetical protein